MMKYLLAAICLLVAACEHRTVDIHNRSITFTRARLGEIVDEFNRLNTRQIRIESPQLAQRAYSGTFQDANPEYLLAMLRLDGGVDIITHGDTIIVKESRRNPR